jgi:hypothetical protein
MEHLTQEDMVPHNEVHDNEDDEEGGDDEECSYGLDGEDDFDRCGLNNNFGEYQDDEKEDGDDISVSSEEEEEEPTPVSQPTPYPHRPCLDTPAGLELELVSNSSSSPKLTLALEVFG